MDKKLVCPCGLTCCDCLFWENPAGEAVLPNQAHLDGLAFLFATYDQINLVGKFTMGDCRDRLRRYIVV